MMLRNIYYIIWDSFFRTTNSYISYTFDYAMSGNHELLFGGKCSQSLSLDYSSIFQSKFMMKQLFCSKSASISLHDVISMTHHLVRVSIHDIFGHIIYRGPETGQNGHFPASLHPALHIHPSITY